MAAGVEHIDEEAAPFEQVKAVLRQELHLEYGVETGDEDERMRPLRQLVADGGNKGRQLEARDGEGK